MELMNFDWNDVQTFGKKCFLKARNHKIYLPLSL